LDTLAQHASTLAAIVGVLLSITLTLFGLLLRGMRDDIKSAATVASRAAESLGARWDKHEEEHREFRRDLLEHEGRLSHLEGRYLGRANANPV